MSDYQVFNPYFFSSTRKNKDFLPISNYSELLFQKAQLFFSLDDFPKLKILFGLLFIIKVTDQLNLFSKTEVIHIQETLQQLVFQCREISINKIIENLKNLIEITKNNVRKEIIILLFSQIAPKGYSTKPLENFQNKITPILNVLPKLAEFEVAALRKRLNKISSIFKKHSLEADKQLSLLIKKYRCA